MKPGRGGDVGNRRTAFVGVPHVFRAGQATGPVFVAGVRGQATTERERIGGGHRRGAAAVRASWAHALAA
jgi:hypothetical protein